MYNLEATKKVWPTIVELSFWVRETDPSTFERTRHLWSEAEPVLTKLVRSNTRYHQSLANFRRAGVLGVWYEPTLERICQVLREPEPVFTTSMRPNTRGQRERTMPRVTLSTSTAALSHFAVSLFISISLSLAIYLFPRALGPGEALNPEAGGGGTEARKG